MEIKLNIKNTENLTNMTQSDIEEMKAILEALVATGGLTGVKGGQTIIHFDAFGVFQKIELKYFPWVRKAERKDPALRSYIDREESWASQEAHEKKLGKFGRNVHPDE